MKAYSADLRPKIVAAYENGEGPLDVLADFFSLARRSVASFLKLQRAGAGLQPKPHGGGVPFSFKAEHLAVLQKQLAAKNDLTLDELVAYLKEKEHLTVHRSTMCRAMHRLGLSRKKSVWWPRSEMKRRASCFASGSRLWDASGWSSLMIHRSPGRFGERRSLLVACLFTRLLTD